MSRRRIRSAHSAFLSDDEDDIDEDVESVVSSEKRTFYQQSQYTTSEQDSSETGSQISDIESRRQRRSNIRNMVTSTPLIASGDHHISTHDHYYDGMLLRSGSHLKGAERYFADNKSHISESDVLLSKPVQRSDVVSSAAYGSDMMEGLSQRRSGRNITTITETTTTTSTTTKDGSMGRDSNQKNALIMEDTSESKLRLDESQTEKRQKGQQRHKKQYRLEHLYGLDSDEEFSDIDEVDLAASRLSTTEKHRHLHTHGGSTWFSFLTTIVTTVITTITTTISDGSSSILTSLAVAASKPVVVPSRWLLKGTKSVVTWLITRSATVLLWDIEVKQRRRRGCCCCLLPLLLLLPWLLLGGYYTREMQQRMGVYLSDTKQALSSSWSYLWLASSSSQEIPVYQPPPPQVTVPVSAAPEPTPAAATVTTNQIDMTEIYQYIQQTVIQAAAANKDERPVGLTQEQVEAIVRALLASEMSGLKTGIEGKMDAVKSVLEGDVTSLEDKISRLQSEIKLTAEAHQTLADNLNQAKASFHGATVDQKGEWLAASQALEHKLLDLTAEVNTLSSQNAALTAMLTNCCRNSSMIADTVRAHVISVLSEMASDEDSQLAGLMAGMTGQYVGQYTGQYVDKDELDRRLSAVTTEIMDSLKILLARMEEERAKAGAEVETTVVQGIDEMVVKNIIEEALIQFSADRVGMPDFALESAGGSVLSVRCSETYYRKTALISIFGIPLWYTSNSPRAVIQPNVNPGECWAFKGQSGYLVIQLSHMIQPTGFTLEHIPRSLAPGGDISSAPKEFAVFGLVSESDTQGINLGNYTYLDNGKPIQYFPIQNHQPGIFQFIELRILGNQGNREYTCIYRFRVHGVL